MGQGGSGSKIHERYFVQKVKLGSGSFATVWRAVDKQNGDTVAIKQMEKQKLNRMKVDMSDIEREVAVMKTCSHYNITQIFDVFEDANCIYLALEYCECGDLSDKIGERGLDISEVETASWMRQILAAISALHSKEICHRDIKPDNFMIKRGLGQSEGQEPPGAVLHILKLADFGLATFHRSDRGLRNTKCGTPHFMAPELHLLPRKSRGYGLPIDVWAAGVSMYVIMFGGQRPFLQNGRFDLKPLVSGTVDWRMRESCFIGLGQLRFSEDARQFCTSMLQVDAKKRVTAAQALRTPWLDHACAGKPLESNPAPREASPLRRWIDLPGRWGMCVANPVCVAEPTTPLKHTGFAVPPSSSKLVDWDGTLPDVPAEATPTRAEAGGGSPGVVFTSIVAAATAAAGSPQRSTRAWSLAPRPSYDANDESSCRLASPEVRSSRPTLLPGRTLACTFVPWDVSKPDSAGNDESSLVDEFDGPENYKAAAPQSWSTAAMTVAFAADDDELKDKLSSSHTAQPATTAADALPVAAVRRSRAMPTHGTAGSKGGVSCSSLAPSRRPEESSLPAAADQEEGVVSHTIWRRETQTAGLTEQQRVAAAGSRGNSPKVGSTVSAGTARWSAVPGATCQPRLLEALTPDPQRRALGVTRHHHLPPTHHQCIRHRRLNCSGI